MDETDPVRLAIPEIQGAGHVSPLVPQLAVIGPPQAGSGPHVATQGVVTAVTSDGFWMQDAAGDGDPATSDAIFVATPDTAAVARGNLVDVTGQVIEVAVAGGLPRTTLAATQVDVAEVAVAVFPTPVVLGPGGRLPPGRVIEDDSFVAFEPATDALDFYETLEGMLVEVTAPEVIAPSEGGRVAILADPQSEGRAERGALTVTDCDLNPERLTVAPDPAVTPEQTRIETAPFAGGLGAFEAVLTTREGAPALVPVEPVPIFVFGVLPGFDPREETALTGAADRMTVASYTLDPRPTDAVAPETDLAATLAREVLDRLGAPDVLSLTFPSGAAGFAPPEPFLAALLDALDLADDGEANLSSPYRLVTDPLAADGPTDQAFLYRADRVSVADTAPLVPEGLPAGQPPAAATFAFRGEAVTLVAPVFAGRAEPWPVFGPEQPAEALLDTEAVNPGIGDRLAAAVALNAALDALLAADPGANILVAGPLGDPGFLAPVADALPGPEGILTDLGQTLPELERYTAIEAGNAVALDHALVSPGLAPGAGFDIVHMNAEFTARQTPLSDRDPLVISLAVGEDAPNRIAGTRFEDALVGTDGDDAIDALGSDDIVAASGGSDLIEGGSGTDTIAYDGVDFGAAALSRDGATVTVQKPGGGTDTLTGIERLDFADGAVLADLAGAEAATAYRLYTAALGRLPDEAGLRFQAALLEDGATRGALARSFVASEEFAALYGADPAPEAYVDALYGNALGREADEAGREFWTGALDGGGLDRAAMLVAFADSPENRAATDDALAAGPFIPDDLLI